MSTVSSGSTDITTTAVPTAPFVEAGVSQIIRIAVFGVITTAALLGNIVVCDAVFQLPYKPLPYLLVANLAVAEIISTLCLPFVFASEYMDNWSFRQVGCTLIIPLQVASMFVVTSTLAVIAVYRYHFIVVQPLGALSSRIVKAILVSLWVIPFLFCLPLFRYHKLFVHKNGKISCYPIFPGDDFVTRKFGNISNSYNIARFIFNFIAPCLVMVLAYVAVAGKLKRFAKGQSTKLSLLEAGSARSQSQSDKINLYLNVEDTTQKAERERRGSPRIVVQLEQDPSVETMQGQIVERDRQNNGGGGGQEREGERKGREHDLVRMFYLVIIIFLVFYIPYQVFFMYIHFGGDWPSRYVYFYLDLLSNLPSALHPLCYGTVSSFYARSFRRLVLCKRVF